MIGEGGADDIQVNPTKESGGIQRIPPTSETIGGGFHKYEVAPSSYEVIDIPSSERDTYVIQTKGRLSCDSVLAWRLDPTGGDHLLMTHYDPSSIKDHLQVLRDNLPRGEGETRTVLLMAGATTANRNKVITDYLEHETGTPPDVVIAGDEVANDDIGRVFTEDPLAYQLIFTRGYNGDPKVRRIIVPNEKGRGGTSPYGYAYEKIFDDTRNNI